MDNTGREDGVKLTRIWDTPVQAPSFILMAPILEFLALWLQQLLPLERTGLLSPGGGWSRALSPQPSVEGGSGSVGHQSWSHILPVVTPVLSVPGQAENIMFLELDLSPPAIFEFERSRDAAEQDPRALHLERLMHLDSLLERPAASRLRKSRSW
uniref:Uncharacterized protein n=1 Tax=Cyanoderma ruficeps TaxID=181631 RepID=A0A8C3QP11_9PASS